MFTTRTARGLVSRRLSAVPKPEPRRARQDAEAAEQEGDQEHVQRERGDPGVGRHRADGHDPALRVEPLEGGSLEKSDRPAAGLAAVFDRAGRRDLPGEIQQIGGTEKLEHGIDRWIGREHGAEAQTHREHHHRETERDAPQVRLTAAKTEVEAGCHQHGVVGPRGDQCHHHEDEKRPMKILCRHDAFSCHSLVAHVNSTRKYSAADQAARETGLQE